MAKFFNVEPVGKIDEVTKSGPLDILFKYRTLLILVVCFIVFTVLRPIFINPLNIMNMLKRTASTAIMAFSMTFIIVLVGIDLSAGPIAAVEGVLLAMMLAGNKVALPLALLLVIAAATFLGFTNGFISQKGHIAPFLVTLATMYAFRGFAMTICGGKPVPIRTTNFAQIFANGRIFDFIPTPIIWMVLFFLLALWLYTKSKFGFFIRAIGGNSEAAHLAGINVDKITILAYTINGFYCAFSGLILAGLMNAGMSDIGETLALDSISAVILGGTSVLGGYGTIWGSLCGALIMGVLNGGLSIMGAQSSQQMLVKGIVIIFALLLSNAMNKRIR
jgi:ribose/xylose/arabinose/galactoside ABC-type transport system permease subunit